LKFLRTGQRRASAISAKSKWTPKNLLPRVASAALRQTRRHSGRRTTPNARLTRTTPFPRRSLAAGDRPTWFFPLCILSTSRHTHSAYYSRVFRRPRRSSIRLQLARTLKAVVSQRLVAPATMTNEAEPCPRIAGDQ